MNKKKILLMLSVLAISAATALSITACNPTSKHGDDEHSYEWTTQTPATCTTPGTDIGVCECGDSVTRTVQPLGHDYVWTDLTDADCTHLATEKGVCRRDGCGNETARDKEGSTALGHDLVTVVLKPATCEEDGSQQVQCKRDGCDYKEAETTITALNHDYKWEHLSDATCDEPAKEKGVCQNDITHTLVRNKEGSTKLGHDIEGLEWVITKPEAQKEGKAVKVCKRDENHVIEIILPKTTETSKYKTFDIVYDSEDVNKDGTATIVYNDPVHGDIEFTISVPPCAHQSEDAIYRTLQPATCEEDGEEEAICPDCGFPVRRAIVAPGHKYPENWTVITTPKASTTGKATKTCTRDSSHKLEVIIPALNEAVAAGARAEGNYTVVETPVGKLTYGSKTYTYIDPEYPDDPVIFTVKNTANDVDKDPELIELLKTAKQYRDQVISITRNGEVIYEAHLPNYMYVNSDEGNGNKYWFVLDGEGKYTTDGTSKYANSNGIILPITAAWGMTNNAVQGPYFGAYSKNANVTENYFERAYTLEQFVLANLQASASVDGIESTVKVDGNTYSFEYTSKIGSKNKYTFEFTLTDGALTKLTITLVSTQNTIFEYVQVLKSDDNEWPEMPSFEVDETEYFDLYYATSQSTYTEMPETLILKAGANPNTSTSSLRPYGFAIFKRGTTNAVSTSPAVQFTDEDGNVYTVKYNNSTWKYELMSEDPDAPDLVGKFIVVPATKYYRFLNVSYVGKGTLKITLGDESVEIPIVCIPTGPKYLQVQVNEYNDATGQYGYADKNEYKTYAGSRVELFGEGSEEGEHINSSYTAEIISDNAESATLTPFTDANGIARFAFVATVPGTYTISLTAAVNSSHDPDSATSPAWDEITIVVKEAPAQNALCNGEYFGMGTNRTKTVTFNGNQVVINTGSKQATFSYTLTGKQFALTYVSGDGAELADALSLAFSEQYNLVLTVDEGNDNVTDYVLYHNDAASVIAALDGTVWGNGTAGKAFKFEGNTVSVYNGSIYGTLEATVTYSLEFNEPADNGAHVYKFLSFTKDGEPYSLFDLIGDNTVTILEGTITGLTFTLNGEEDSDDYSFYKDNAQAAYDALLGSVYRSLTLGYVFEFGDEGTVKVYDLNDKNGKGDLLETLTFKLAIAEDNVYAFVSLVKTNETPSQILFTKGNTVTISGTDVTNLTITSAAGTTDDNIVLYNEEVEVLSDTLTGTMWVYSNDSSYGVSTGTNAGIYNITFMEDEQFYITFKGKTNGTTRNVSATYRYKLVPTDTEGKFQFKVTTSDKVSGTTISYSTHGIYLTNTTKDNYVMFEDGVPVLIKIELNATMTGGPAMFKSYDDSLQEVNSFLEGRTLLASSNYTKVTEGTSSSGNYYYYYLQFTGEDKALLFARDNRSAETVSVKEYAIAAGFSEDEGSYVYTFTSEDGDTFTGYIGWNGAYAFVFEFEEISWVISQIEDGVPTYANNKTLTFALAYVTTPEEVVNQLAGKKFLTQTSGVAQYEFEFKDNNVVTVYCEIDKFYAEYTYTVVWGAATNSFDILFTYVSGHMADYFLNVDYFNQYAKVNYDGSTLIFTYANNKQLVSKDPETGAYKTSSSTSYTTRRDLRAEITEELKGNVYDGANGYTITFDNETATATITDGEKTQTVSYEVVFNTYHKLVFAIDDVENSILCDVEHSITLVSDWTGGIRVLKLYLDGNTSSSVDFNLHISSSSDN